MRTGVTVAEVQFTTCVSAKEGGALNALLPRCLHQYNPHAQLLLVVTQQTL